MNKHDYDFYGDEVRVIDRLIITAVYFMVLVFLTPYLGNEFSDIAKIAVVACGLFGVFKEYRTVFNGVWLFVAFATVYQLMFGI